MLYYTAFSLVGQYLYNFVLQIGGSSVNIQTTMTNLSTYYELICKTPLMSRDEEFDTFLELQDDSLSEKQKDAIRDKIIKANLRFVFKQAKYFSKNDPILFEQLIAAGNEGLLVGLSKYKPDRAVRFLTYAGWWIDQRIKKEMSQMRIVSLPVWKQQLAARIQKFIDTLERDPTLQELKEKFPDVPEKYLKELQKTRYLTFYIDDLGDDPSFQVDPISDEVETRLDKERINDTVASLPSPHRDIIELSFGLSTTTDTGISNSDIAKQLNLSKEQVRLYRKEALAMLGTKLGKP